MLRLNRKVREKRGRAPDPSYLIIDSQSVKSAAEGPERGFHGGKKVKGRGRQIAVDTQGLIWAVHVHAANKSDTMEGCVLADLAMENAPATQTWCADAGYRGTFENYVSRERSAACPSTSVSASTMYSRCCPGAGWWSAPSPGATASAA